MAAADGYPELGLDGLCNIPVGAALAEADGGDPVAGDLEFEVGVGAAVSRRCSWTTSWMAMAASHVPGIGDSLRIRPRSVTWYHSPSMMMYLPPLP